MSEEEDNGLKTTVGEDWDWTQVQDVWERISSLHDHFKKTGVELPWTARGSLFAAMQMFLLECGGDVSLARAVIADLLQLCSGYVAGQVLASMRAAWERQELEGQKLNPLERARLKGNIETMESGIESSKIEPLSPEKLEAMLGAQDALAPIVDEVHGKYGPEATVRALVAIVQQSELFANQGDVMGAKTSVLDLLHQIWPVALHNAQKLIKIASQQLKGGPAASRPN
jgi:hypothetical protein